MKSKSLLTIIIAGLLFFTITPCLSAREDDKNKINTGTASESNDIENKIESAGKITSKSDSKHEIDKWLDAELERNYSTTGMIQAYSEAQKKWDAELNKNYKTLMNALDKTAQESLKKAQNAWIKQRDLEFNIIKNIYGKKDGSMYRPMAVYAVMEIVKNRALDLKHYHEILND